MKLKHTNVQRFFLYKLDVDVVSVESKRHIREVSLSNIGYETGYNIGHETTISVTRLATISVMRLTTISAMRLATISAMRLAILTAVFVAPSAPSEKC